MGVPGGPLIGVGDGSASSVTFTVIHEQDQQRRPSGLSFHTERPDELWVVNYMDDSVIIIQNPGQPNMTSTRRKDPAAGHFMHFPTAISFGVNNSWGVCGENDGGGNDFTGPSLMPADLAIFAKQTPDGLGSHLDMLHASPFCMGIAHERDNVYWIVDGQNGAIVRYDFVMDHGPGNDDHSDGVIQFYAMGQIKRLAKVPSNLVFDPSDGQLYVADTGNKRIVALDTKSGTVGAAMPSLEPAIPHRMMGDVLVELVAPGTLEAPSGITLKDKFLYVTDQATSAIHAFDLTGKLVRSLDTGLPAGSLAGLTVGPDGKIYFVDSNTSRVLRIDVPEATQ
jgi:DNA-binding beta-propeller fold protein YncE